MSSNRGREPSRMSSTWIPHFLGLEVGRRNRTAFKLRCEYYAWGSVPMIRSLAEFHLLRMIYVPSYLRMMDQVTG